MKIPFEYSGYETIIDDDDFKLIQIYNVQFTKTFSVFKEGERFDALVLEIYKNISRLIETEDDCETKLRWIEFLDDEDDTMIIGVKNIKSSSLPSW